MASSKWKKHQYVSFMMGDKKVQQLNELAVQLDVSRSSLVRRGVDLLFERVDQLVAVGNSDGHEK